MNESMEELAKTAKAIKRLDTRRLELIETRNEQIRAARADGAKWREMALLLGMTEHGVIKAANGTR